jgi:phenylacetic acid degradation operon negative regulatory protein
LLQAFRCDVPVQILIRAAALFDIDENRTRVALHRLRTKGLIESRERGTYHVNPRSAVYAEAFGWRTALARLQPWDGHWIAVHTAPLPRADKTIARRRDRATRMVGLRELVPGLLVRPDNLQGGVEAARERLTALGLEEEAAIFRVDALGPHERVARGLWDSLLLDLRYREHLDRLNQLSDAFSTIAPEEAARQAWIVGGRAVLDIVLDPLLPEPLVDPALRDRFVSRMAAFDDQARETWGRVLGTELTLRQAPNACDTAPEAYPSDPAEL